MPTVIDGSTGVSQVQSGSLSFLVGQVCFFAMNSAPAGFLVADGSAVSRTTYAALFALIGTTYGAGNGSTTFNLPDLRGEFIRGVDNGRGVDSGRGIGTAQDHAMQTHDHRIDVNRNLAYAGGGGRANDAPDVNDAYSGNGGIDRTSPPIGVNTAAETRPRNVALLACIKF